MKNVLRKYIQESLRFFLFENGTLKGCENALQNEISTLAGVSITGHVAGSLSDEELEDDLKSKSKDSTVSSFGGGQYAE